MDITRLGRYFAQLQAVQHLVIQQLLGLGAVGDQGLVAHAQGAVGSDPPVFSRRSSRLAWRQQLTLALGHAIALHVRLRHRPAGDGRAGCDQRLQPFAQFTRRLQCQAAAEQVTQSRTVQLRAALRTALEVGDTQPARMLGTGQGDIEQAQVLGQAFVVGALDLLGIGGERQVRHAIVVMPGQGQALAIHRFAGADERQVHQGILQALGLVDGHHLDQLLVAFQAQNLLLPTCPALARCSAR